MREGVLSLRHTDYITLNQPIFLADTTETRLTGKVAISLAGVGFHLLLCELAELDTICTVNFLGDDLDLLLDRQIQVVEELEVRLAFADSDDGFSESTGTHATFRLMIADDSRIGTSSERLLTNELELSRRVGTANKE